MNWVQKKIVCERILEVLSPELWNGLRGALQDACESYNLHYAPESKKQIKCELENGKRVLLQKTLHLEQSKTAFREDPAIVIVSFEKGPPRISVAGDGPVQSRVFVISSNEERVFLVGDADKPLEIEEVSKRILAPLLFPTAPYSDPL